MTKSLASLCRIKRWISHWSDRAILAPKQILYHTHHTIYWCTLKLGTVTRTECKYIYSTKDMNGNLFWVFFSTWVMKRLKEWVSRYRPSLLYHVTGHPCCEYHVIRCPCCEYHVTGCPCIMLQAILVISCYRPSLLYHITGRPCNTLQDVLVVSITLQAVLVTHYRPSLLWVSRYRPSLWVSRYRPSLLYHVTGRPCCEYHFTGHPCITLQAVLVSRYRPSLWVSRYRLSLLYHVTGCPCCITLQAVLVEGCCTLPVTNFTD